MSRKQSEFIVLPNEVIYHIFDYLTSNDIIRAFAQLNDRYDNLVRFYIKHIDLTDEWEGDRRDLHWISRTIQSLKFDQFYLHLFNHSNTEENLIFNVKEENSPPESKKRLFSSIMKQIVTLFQKKLTSTRGNTPLVPYQFPRLHSLQLVDVVNWNNIVSKMNLNRLDLSFTDDIRHCSLSTQIPHTVTRFSSNISLNPHMFHKNITNLNIHVSVIDDIVEIVRQTPNVQYLSVTFSEHLYVKEYMDDYRSDHFEKMTANIHRLNKLSRLSVTTRHAKELEHIARLPLGKMQIFIDRCCPDKTILKKVALKFDYTWFHDDIWPAIIRYKNTYDRFDFYASFIVKDKSSRTTIIPSCRDDFPFHIEDGDATDSYDCFVHIYSLPFGFDKLHGFISCAELSPQCSFSSVRHLYFTETHLKRLVSFKSLPKRMPNLISINCNFCFVCQFNIIDTTIITDEDIFSNIRFLHFISRCKHVDCLCRNLLPQLLDRMPQLHSLTTSIYDFIHGQHILPPIKRLDLQECRFELFDTLAERLSHLSRIVLDDMPTCTKQLSQLLSSLFMGIPLLKSIIFKGPSIDWDQPTSYKVKAEKAIAQVQKLNNRLRYLKLNLTNGAPAFYLQCL